MSRPAAATQQKPEPRIRRARFAEEDLVSTFGEATLAEARRLLGAGAVDLTTTGPAIEATIVADGEHRRVSLTPTQTGQRVAFLGTCEPRFQFSESGPPQNAIVLRYDTGRGEPSSSGRSNALTPIALSSLPACGDFDIEKMRPEWRDEVYQNWRAVRQLRLKRDGAREVGQLFLVRPGRRGPLSAR